LAERAVKRLFWWLLVGTRGGLTRLIILLKLLDGPTNANKIATALRLNYKTVQHHLEVLLENRLVECVETNYEKIYRPSVFVLENLHVLEEIVRETVSAGKVKANVTWDRSG